MRRILRPISEGFRGIVRHFGMSLSAIAAVMVTLLILGVFLLFYENVNGITTHIEESVQIYVKIDRGAEGNQEQQETQMKTIEGVATIEFISKDQEILTWINEYGDVWSSYQGENNPFNDAYTVTIDEGASIVDIANKIDAFSWSTEVNYGGVDTESMMSILQGTRYIGYAFVAALTLLAIFLISNTIKMSINSRATEIGIMRIVGATNSFIRAPFVVEGIIIGLVGSILPILVVILGYQRLYTALDGQVLVSMFQMTEPFPMVLNVSLVIVIISILVGVLGSFISVTRYLRWKR